MPITESLHTPETSEQAIRDLEKRLRIKFPPQYRAFLLRTNGGRPHPEECYGEGGFSHLNMFFSVEHERESYTIESARRALIDRVPRNLLPIGLDAGGSQVCIGIGWRNRGRIYFWSMDDEHLVGRRPSYRNVMLLSNSFDEFVETFRDPDEYR